MAVNMYGEWIIVLGVNPESWAIGTAFAARKAGQIKGGMSPNEKLRVFKAALAEELKLRDLYLNPDETHMFELELMFCRQVESYLTTTGKRKTGNYSDNTNLQKATEDALQGILLHNDRQVVRNLTTTVIQRPGVEPFIGIKLRRVEESFLDSLYDFVMGMSEFEKARQKSEVGDNSW